MKPGAWPAGGWTERIRSDIVRMLTSGLTFRDNFSGAPISFTATSGTEAVVANPIAPAMPVGFIPYGAKDLNGANLTIAYVPVLNLSRTDGYLGITVSYTGGTTVGIVQGFVVGG